MAEKAFIRDLEGKMAIYVETIEENRGKFSFALMTSA